MERSAKDLAILWPYPRHRRFEKYLQDAAAGWFRSRKAKTDPRRPYILAEWDDWPKNLVCPTVVDYINRVRNERSGKVPFALHKYIHHGLSSQAFLFNLVGPLIVSKGLEPLRIMVEGQGMEWPGGEPEADLEYVDRGLFNEDSGQPTSIDLVIKDADGRPSLCIECKLVEKDFGGCSVFKAGDCDGRNPSRDFDLCYLHFIGRRYWQLMEKHGFLTDGILEDGTCVLANHYQFFRELIFAIESGGSFLLLSDERSPTFHCGGPAGDRGLMARLLELVPSSLRPRVGSISTQKLIMAIKQTKRHGWITDFEKKYGLQT